MLFGHGMVAQLLSARNSDLPIEYILALMSAVGLDSSTPGRLRDLACPLLGEDRVHPAGAA